jgi:hypothetical protein
MTDRLFISALAGLGALAAGLLYAGMVEADAQEVPKCAPLKQFFADMRKAEMSEVAVGLINPQVSFVVFASPGGAQWVMVTIGTTGAACPVMSGTGWDNEPIVPEGRPA